MAAPSESRPEPGMKLFLLVWLGLMLIVAAETVLTYEHLSTGALLASLLMLAVIEAALAVMYFMRMRWERPALMWALFPYLIFAMIMMNHLWPDAHRLLRLRAPTP